MTVLDTFQHNGQTFEIRNWFDQSQSEWGEWVARAFLNGKAVDGYVYSCSAAIKMDLGDHNYNKMIVDAIKSDIIEDRFQKMIKLVFNQD